jgi:ankyrin repeat protein
LTAIDFLWLAGKRNDLPRPLSPPLPITCPFWVKQRGPNGNDVAICTLPPGVSGADIEARDIKGETPLRRALNCRQPGMIGLLLARGANPNVPDKRGVTPRQAAKKRGLRIGGVRNLPSWEGRPFLSPWQPLDLLDHV